MKKIILYMLTGVVFLSACTSDITDFNEETKRAATVPQGPLFTNALKNMSDGLASASVNVNTFRHFIKHWGQAVIQEDAQYDYITRSINDNWWNRMYRDVINDLRESARIIGEDESLSPEEKANQLAMVDIIEVYAFSILVDTFGDIPYSESLDSENLFPVYDDARTIYIDLLTRISNDITNLNPQASGFDQTEDLFFQGDVAQWVVFANSLKIRMAFTLADVDEGTAQTAFEHSNSSAINTADDNAFVQYFSSPPNNNPLYDQLVLAGRTDFIASKDLMDVLLELEDPRLPGFFGTNDNGEYRGGVVGQASNYADMSKPSGRVADPAVPNVFFDYSEMEFIRAEAKERGYSVSGTAEDHYNNAIRASISYWGGSEAEADAYLSRPEVAYTTAEGDWRQKIGFQKWLALYNRPFRGWVEYRRLDAPDLPLPFGAISGFPNRLRYPNNEQQLNGTNYTQAAEKIGGDETENKLFWDVF